MWVCFTKPFDWDPPERGGLVTIAYRAGDVRNVTRGCGEAAKAQGAAEDHTPAKDDVQVDVTDSAEDDRRG